VREEALTPMSQRFGIVQPEHFDVGDEEARAFKQTCVAWQVNNSQQHL